MVMMMCSAVLYKANQTGTVERPHSKADLLAYRRCSLHAYAARTARLTHVRTHTHRCGACVCLWCIVTIDGTEWRGIKFISVSPQWMSNMKAFPVAVFGTHAAETPATTTTAM